MHPFQRKIIFMGKLVLEYVGIYAHVLVVDRTYLLLLE